MQALQMLFRSVFCLLGIMTTVSTSNAQSVVAYLPPPGNNSFSGETVTIHFNSRGVSEILDSKGNGSLNQQVNGVVTLQIQVDGKTAQTLRIIGPTAPKNLDSPKESTRNPSNPKVVAHMPLPANNTFSGETVTVKFDERGVSDVTDSKGNRSLNQQVNGAVTLQIQLGGKKVKTIYIVDSNKSSSTTRKYQASMKPGDILQENELLVSANGKFQLRGTVAGDFVIEPTAIGGAVRHIFPLLNPFSPAPTVSVLKFQQDGNIVINSKQGKAYYATTGRDAVAPIILNKSSRLELTDTGRLVIVDKNGKEIWAASK